MLQALLCLLSGRSQARAREQGRRSRVLAGHRFATHRVRQVLLARRRCRCCSPVIVIVIVIVILIVMIIVVFIVIIISVVMVIVIGFY